MNQRKLEATKYGQINQMSNFVILNSSPYWSSAKKVHMELGKMKTKKYQDRFLKENILTWSVVVKISDLCIQCSYVRKEQFGS